MVDYTQIEISTNLKEQLQNMATEKNTDIDNVIKLALAENTQLKKKPDNFMDTSKVSSKANKDKDGNIKSYSFSTAIPKPILNKLGLTKGQVLYWDIDEYKIIITPEVKPTPVPEEESIQAGYDILQDMLINGNTTHYLRVYEVIVEILNIPTDKVTTNSKVTQILNYCKNEFTNYMDEVTQVVKFLLDYPLNLPDQYEILGEVYKEITKD